MAPHISGFLRLGLAACRSRRQALLGTADRSQALASLQLLGRCFTATPHRLEDIPGGNTGSTDKVRLHFINRDGEKYSVTAKEGESFLEVVMNQNVNIDGFGACEGTLACSTCHLIFKENAFRQLGPISDDELDMLDLAYGLTETSRLGCQVHVKQWMDGLTVHVPMEVSDIRKELEVEKQSKQ
ncbi:adrenodoxin, mitochondrial-like isoform X1 [Rhineura floridana]|uniref:adrenodoxin, mitochondrial-like isoform X1 n=1 Tax=Rhineura floridana TaxID=261503 RepID=UPI002AC871F9|nr:adrenodoxin, mitochondrial-like isoform X1 [Rhineura floridana]